MEVKLSAEQMNVLKKMMEFSGNFADQLLHIMQNHGLDKLNGCRMSILVDPAWVYSTKSVTFGYSIETDAGMVTLTRGKNDNEYLPIGKNSAEYEILFANKAVREALQELKSREKPFPPDGLWVGDSRNDPPMDSGWDLEDEDLSE